MNLGLYLHIPHCLQKCHYCDFTTFSMEHRISLEDYTELLLTELRNRAKYVSIKNLRSIYFGGGTPSLLPTKNILTLVEAIDNEGFVKDENIEITLEINPGTIDQQRLDQYLSVGINRFSVGVQTFNDDFLTAINREHTAEDSMNDLRLLEKNQVNYSMDLLFGLPSQSLAHVQEDLRLLKNFNPPHVSAYCMTVPETHFMNKGRASDDEQNAMYANIEEELRQQGILRYELSNYARPGFESQHNLIYWNDLPYWGLGISAHSYFPDAGDYGLRFWNSTQSKRYEESIKPTDFEMDQFWQEAQLENEPLKKHEAMTDYCHTQLRKIAGLQWVAFEKKFGTDSLPLLKKRAALAVKLGLAKNNDQVLCLTDQGRLLANKSFLQFTFLQEDLIS